MTPPTDVSVRLDERIRLLSALLAATDWPDRAQARKPHGCHAHARATRKHVAALAAHPAARTLQTLLDRGAPMEALFSFAAVLDWPSLAASRLPSWAPADWPDHLRDFHASADLDSWHRAEDAAWQKSLSEVTRLLQGITLKPFLRTFFGDIVDAFVFMPNIGYPADVETGVRAGRELIAIVPPRLAWGDSAPWPFDDDPVYLYRAALTQYTRLLLASYLRAHADRLAEAEKTPLPVPDVYARQYPTWQAQFINLFTSGLIAIFLEDCVSPAEAQSYVLLQRKAYGVALLPSVVSVLRRYLEGVADGRYSGLADFLPLFPKQLRVAKRIVSL